MERQEQLYSVIKQAALDLIQMPADSQQEREATIEPHALCQAYSIIKHGAQEMIPEFTQLHRAGVLVWAAQQQKKAA